MQQYELLILVTICIVYSSPKMKITVRKKLRIQMVMNC